MSGVRIAAIRPQLAKRSSTVRLTGVWAASSRMSAPAANARVPAPVSDDRPAVRIAIERSSVAASASSRSKLSALSASRRSIVTRAT